MYEYNCKIVRVVDGDTVDVDIDLGFGIWKKKERIRLYGIDTPESRTSDKEEKIYGNYVEIDTIEDIESSITQNRIKSFNNCE